MWIVYCGLCLIAWGLWGFFPKLAQRHLDPMSAAVYQGAGTFLFFAPIAIAALIMSKFFPSLLTAFRLPALKLAWHPTGVTFALLAGLGAASGGLFYVFATSKANVSVVVTITALYPIITILLGWRLLGEQIQIWQWAGIALALIAMALVAYTPKP